MVEDGNTDDLQGSNGLIDMQHLILGCKRQQQQPGPDKVV